MVRPAQRRAVVGWAQSAYPLPERRACRAVGVWRSVFRYRSVRPRHEALRQRMKELAATRVRAGYRQLPIYLRREGWSVNPKRVHRLYTEEGANPQAQAAQAPSELGGSPASPGTESPE